MKTKTFPDVKSEQGIALVVVLLLMAVMMGVATGFAVNGRIEGAMAENEVYFAGARAAAEAGLNRAIEAVTNNDDTAWVSGQDGAVDALDASASVNADNGSLGFLLAGTSPYSLDAAGDYTYTVHIYDDDDPILYSTALTADQLLAMGEDGSAYTDANSRLILRATGFGPKNTQVTIARVLESLSFTSEGETILTNAALLVDGGLTISGNPSFLGTHGSVHANGDLDINGSSTYVEQDATASGTFTANEGWEAGGTQGGGTPTVTVPDINAADYFYLADFVLAADGTLQDAATGTVLCTANDNNAGGCNGYGWRFASGTWRVANNENSMTSGTYYAYTDVRIEGSPGSSKTPAAVSIISEGNIEVSGTPYFTPENPNHIQFVTNKDLKLSGNVDADPASAVEGQSLVREQLMISGNPELRGQIIVQDVESISDLVTTNTVSGNPVVTYNGSFGGIPTVIPGETTYTNNVSGWIE
jgi:hypothetical protein